MSTTRGASSINTNFEIQHRPTHSTRLLTGTHHTAGFLPRLLNTCAANQQVCSAKRHPTYELHAIQQMRPSAARNQLAVHSRCHCCPAILLPTHTPAALPSSTRSNTRPAVYSVVTAALPASMLTQRLESSRPRPQACPARATAALLATMLTDQPLD